LFHQNNLIMIAIAKDQLYLVAIYIVFFVFSIFLSTVLNFLLLKFAATLGIRSNTEKITRWSNLQKPALGGITFFIIYLIGLAFVSFFFEMHTDGNNLLLLGIFFVTIIAFALGLFDDAYNTKPFIKFFTQLTCGVILVITGNYIKIFPTDIANYLFTIFWVVGIMNSINMLDNMDGITTLVTLFIVITLLIKFFLFGELFNPNFFLMIGIVGSLLSFLFFNMHPSKMYMGDTGSQFLGIVLAIIGISYFWNTGDLYGNLIPTKQFLATVILFALPIIDTTTVFIKRISKGKSPFIGGKDHTTHHLAYLGLNPNQVAFVFAGLTFLSGIIAISILFIVKWSYILISIYALYFLILFIVLFIIANKNKKLSE